VTTEVLLVYPGVLHGGDWGAGPRVKPALGQAGPVRRRGGVGVVVGDLDADLGPAAFLNDETMGDAADELARELDAGVVAICCWSALEYLATLAVAEAVRRRDPGVTVAVWGHHPTIRPGDFTFDGAPFDVVVQGDPERSIMAIARDVADARATGPIAGGTEPVAGADHGVAVVESVATEAPLVVAGEALSLTTADLPDYAAYPLLAPGLDVLGVYLSRGCQYHNAVCSLGPGGGRWRAFAPDDAAELLQDLTALGADEVEVLDPTFGLDGAWRAETLRQLARKSRRDARLTVSGRPDALQRADVDALYDARLGLRLTVGTLSSTLMRVQEVPGAARRLDDTLDLIRYLNAKGVSCELDFSFGEPGESRESAAETLATLEGLVDSFPNTSLTLVGHRWAYLPMGTSESDVEAPARRYGTVIERPEWWKDEVDPYVAAHAVVPSADLADLPAGDDRYWRPRFNEVAAAFDDKLTYEARNRIRSHESVGSGAADVPHGFYREPRWH